MKTRNMIRILAGLVIAATTSSIYAQEGDVSQLRKQVEELAQKTTKQASELQPRCPQIVNENLPSVRNRLAECGELTTAPALKCAIPILEGYSRTLETFIKEPMCKKPSQDQLAAQQSEAKACEAVYVKTGLPDKWRHNYVGFGPGISPTELIEVVCFALSNGAQVRYLSGGVFGKEGFEVRSSKRTVQIFPQIEPMSNDPAVKIMMPAQANVMGKKIDIISRNNFSQSNFQLVIGELLAAIKNE